MSQVAKRCLISGQVQGVCYRASTQEQAQKLGVTGWVQNLPDGRVEALICGDEQSVATLLDWMKQGPPLAKVRHIEVTTKPYSSEYNEFIIN